MAPGGDRIQPVGVRDLKNKMTHCLETASKGDTIIITGRKVPVASSIISIERKRMPKSSCHYYMYKWFFRRRSQGVSGSLITKRSDQLPGMRIGISEGEHPFSQTEAHSGFYGCSRCRHHHCRISVQCADLILGLCSRADWSKERRNGKMFCLAGIGGELIGEESSQPLDGVNKRILIDKRNRGVS